MNGSISRRSALGALVGSVTAPVWAQAPQAPEPASGPSASAAATLNIAQRMARYVGRSRTHTERVGPSGQQPAASALAAGKLMGLPAEKFEQAVNIALNEHIAMNQTRVQQLSDWKNLADADAGRNGVFATLLARQGITGPSPIYEGNAGFFKMISGPFEIDVDQFGGSKVSSALTHVG